MEPTWGPSGADRTQVGPMLAPWTLLSEYGISKPQCISWEDPDVDYPFYRYYERQLGRRLLQGNLVVARVTDKFHTVDPDSLSRVNGGLSEKLVADSSCEVAWVPHDANSGHTLPADVLIGGVLTATNTPLYVARQKLNAYHITGYYNPVRKIAWAEFWISGNVAINNTVFEVMTVTRLWQHWLTDDEKMISILLVTQFVNYW